MSHLQDIAKVASGLVMVVKESIKMAPKGRAGDIGGTTVEVLKVVAGTVTDLTGLTQGSVQDYHSHETVQQYQSHKAVYKQERELGRGVKPMQSFTNEESTSGPDARNVSYLHKPLHSLTSFGYRSPPSAQNKTQEVLSKVQEAVQQTVRESPIPKSLENFAPETPEALSNVGERISSSRMDNPPSTSRDFEGKLRQSEQAMKAEQVLQAPHKGLGVAAGEASIEESRGVRVPLKKRKVRERRVPATPFGRVLGFAGLGAGLAWGTVQESARRLWGGQGPVVPGQAVLSPFLTEANAERLALALCRMRGAALKVGQMLSIQDESIVPRPILEALERVRQGADVMPKRQLMKVIEAELGPNWRHRLQSFEDEPIASASIGQVHKAVLRDGKEVAMKVQYPGVANSIDSDIENVKRLLDYTNVIPEGLYLDQAIRVAKEELARECDYKLEAANQKRFRELLLNEKGLYVPLVFDEFCSTRVLTTELVPGVSVDRVKQLDQKVRDRVGTQLLSLTLRELFTFRFMQTDPNWGNFLYDEAKDTINLIDFGAARAYPRHFVDDYLKMVLACANRDRDQVIKMSISLGFLTGKESKIMLDTHVEAAFVVGLPFAKPGGFDFRTTDLTQQVTRLGATMLRHRLTAPPDEAYSLHRKLSGSFLACVKLGAVVHCRQMFMDVYDNHKFSSEDGDAPAIRSVAGIIT